MRLFAKVLTLALVVVPFSASAVSLYGTTDVKVDTSAGAKTDAGASVKGDAGGSSGNDVEVKDDGAAGVQVQVGGNTDTNATTNAEASITGDPDFDLFAKSVTTSNAEVSAVDLDADGKVDVAYKHKGWLFGFIPVMLTSHTTVTAESDGTAKAHVSLPWWSFLVSGVSQVKSDTEAALDADVDVKANASVQTSTNARVKLVEVMVSSLAKADAAAKASYDLKAGTK